MAFEKGNISWNKGKKGVQIAWNKGKRIQLNTGKTHFKKGHIPWCKGKKLSKEHVEKIRENSRKRGTKHLEKLRFKKGHIPWNKGKSIYLGGRRFEKGMIPWNKGKKGLVKWTEEQKKKYSQMAKKKGYGKWMKGKKLTKEHIKNVLRKREKSSLEIKVDKVIKKYNLPYKFVGNGDFFIERKNPDFINTNGKKIAIEVFCKRHKNLFSKKGYKGWKKARVKIFSKYGWKILFIEDWQVNNESYLLKTLEGG